ncbi:MAG: LuxR C-terminal-related transcriptional regulator [bacterium]|nr:LuxR C-terminal-related transcriptional regulator [bacterium]
MGRKVSEKTLYLEPRVLKLRQRGRSNQQISEELSEPVWRVKQVNSRLLASGKTSSRRGGTLSDRQINKRESAIAVLRANGVPNAQIAANLDIGKTTLNNHISRMIKDKRTEPRAPGNRALPAARVIKFWKKPGTPEFDRFVELVRVGKTYGQISKRYGCSKARIGQIVKIMRARYGAATFTG